MFKRRTPKTYFQIFREAIYPRGGWLRAANYVMHRIKRTPDTPHRISMGVAAGVFVTYSPFFGLHFILAAILAFILRGNVLVSLAATFYGNPLTFPIIGIVSHQMGLFMLGRLPSETRWPEVRDGLVDFVAIPWRNFKAMFTKAEVNWNGFGEAIDLVIFPYLVGGIIPGFISAIVAYAISKPLVRAYQNRRKGRITARLKQIGSTAKKRFDKKEAKDV